MPVLSDNLMRQAILKAKEAQLAIISHCEPENEQTEREIKFSGELNLPVHIAHVSTKESVEMVTAAKANGVKITCEAAPHHFFFTEKELEKRDADYKMNPPLRGGKDVAAVIQGIKDGVFDCIASDHAPHSSDEKADFDSAPNGVLGLETILAASLTKLYHENGVPLNQIVQMLCVNPRKILAIAGGGLQPGEPADICIFDLNEKWTVKPDKLASKSRNTCFKGVELTGRVKYTIVNGKVVYNGIR
jgi:dihydroorotase